IQHTSLAAEIPSSNRRRIMKLRTQLFLGYLIVFALMVFNAAIIYKSTNSLIKAQNIIENTNRNIDAAGRIETLTVELQNTKRAVLLNPTDDFGRRFEKIREQHKQEIDDLKNEVSNNPAQLRILNDIERRIQIWINSAAIPQMTAVQNNQKRSESEVLPVDLEDGKGRSLFGESFSQVQSFMKNERGIREEQLKQNDQLAAETIWVVVLGTLVALFAGSTVALTTTSKVIRQVGGEPESISRIAQEIGKGNLEIQFEGDPKEGSGIRAAIESMKESLRRNRQETQDREWLKTGIGRLNTVMSGDPDPETLASKVISEMTTYVGAQIGACYFVGNGAGTTLKLLGSYAFNGSDDPNRIFEFGNGLVGQAALENRQVLISDVPEDYFKIRSGVGEKVPNTICITPFTYEGYVKGVIEIGSLKDISELHSRYLPIGFLRPCQHGGILLDGCMVPEESLIGSPGTAYEDMAVPFRDVEDTAMMGPLLGAQEARFDDIVQALQKKGELLQQETAYRLGGLYSSLGALEVLARESALVLEDEGVSESLLPLVISFRSQFVQVHTEMSEIASMADLHPSEGWHALSHDLDHVVNFAGRVSRLKQIKLGAGIASGGSMTGR
ncbi:MAG: GAF domain-containing protein, partial [Desulfobacterota bacterium]|nr:GAF domain-containing protein [Thermodesulfobacteriota bacterium]